MPKQGFHVRFFTNNSGISETNLIHKLTRMGFDPAPGEVFAIGPMAIEHCISNGYENVFVVGEPDLIEGFNEAGIRCQEPGKADAVVAGICRSFSYELCNQAMQAILNSAEFIATNRDPTYPLENGRLQPGTGAIIAAIETSSGKAPTVLGKPNPWAIKKILSLSGLKPDQLLVVGPTNGLGYCRGRCRRMPIRSRTNGCSVPNGKVVTLD